MKYSPPADHPDVSYWACPEGDYRLLVPGYLFNVLSLIGSTVEPSDLADVMPPSLLEHFEDTVELHEDDHMSGAA